MTHLIKDNKVITESEFRQLFKDTSFGPVINFDEFGYDVVFPSPAPTCDSITQSVRSIAPVLTNKGHYEQAWEVIDLDAETIAANQVAKKAVTNAAIWQQVEALERQHQMPRHLRDLIPADHPARVKADSLDVEIATLKAGLL